MSKIGKTPVIVPENVKVEIKEKMVVVSGPKGFLSKVLPSCIDIKNEDGNLILSLTKKTKQNNALFGTYRSHIANMVKGVSEGWLKRLELVGTGYRVELKDTVLVLNVGYSHPVEFQSPDGITFSVEKSDVIIEGADKELVGLLASKIRAVRPPEPYKGKGIKYKDEVIRRKAGKAAKTAA